MKKILLIGLGPFARRIYYPILKELRIKYNVEIAGIVELETNKTVIENYLKGQHEKIIYISQKEADFALRGYLAPKTEQKLNSLKIDGVIISTEPLVHMSYARWALHKPVHILMDKPISTKQGVSSDMKKAKELIRDYDELASMYRQVMHKISFTIMAQRRYHSAFILIRNKIREVFELTKCPITSIVSFHSDGQWRMPTEIVEQHYHPYNQGYGKVSHSGYHSLDIINYMMDVADIGIDNVDIFTNFVKPNDFLAQLSLDEYEQMFPTFRKYNKYSTTELRKLMEDFGELDAFNSFSFKKQCDVITLGSNNLLHNSFSQRSWVTAQGRDLYKGNGRVRHEVYIIEQGPFQSITYLSYQGQEVDPNQNEGLYDFGGEYHLDIHVFRNDKMFPIWRNYEQFSIADLEIPIMKGKSRGHQEDARRKAIIEFLQNMNGIKKSTSDLLDHRRSVLLMSGIYQSAIKRRQGENPLVNLKYSKKSVK